VEVGFFGTGYEARAGLLLSTVKVAQRESARLSSSRSLIHVVRFVADEKDDLSFGLAMTGYAVRECSRSNRCAMFRLGKSDRKQDFGVLLNFHSTVKIRNEEQSFRFLTARARINL